MPRKCSICARADRAEIDAAIIAGEAMRGISRRFAVSPDAVERHRKAHISSELARAQDAAEVTRADTLLDQVRALQAQAGALVAEALAVLRRAKRSNDGALVLESVRTAAVALREARGLVSLLTETATALTVSDANVRARVGAELEALFDVARGVLDDGDFRRLLTALAYPVAPDETGGRDRMRSSAESATT